MACSVQEALSALSLEVRELSVGSQVPRVSGPLDPLQFYREYVAPNRPVIVENAIDHWPALKLWTNEYLLEKIGHTLVSVAVTPDGRGDAVVDEVRACREFGCRVRQEAGDDPSARGGGHGMGGVEEGGAATAPSTPEEATAAGTPWRGEPPNASWQAPGGSATRRPRFPIGVPYAQHQNGSLLSEFAELAGDVDPHIPWASRALGLGPEAVNFWMGGATVVTSFHKDHYENLYAVVAGAKRFTLLPPVDFHRLYVQGYRAAQYRHDEVSPAVNQFPSVCYFLKLTKINV
eukprot:jgi/Mesen1/6894/ME000353S05918